MKVYCIYNVEVYIDRDECDNDKGYENDKQRAQAHC